MQWEKELNIKCEKYLKILENKNGHIEELYAGHTCNSQFDEQVS